MAASWAFWTRLKSPGSIERQRTEIPRRRPRLLSSEDEDVARERRPLHRSKPVHESSPEPTRGRRLARHRCRAPRASPRRATRESRVTFPTSALAIIALACAALSATILVAYLVFRPQLGRTAKLWLDVGMGGVGDGHGRSAERRELAGLRGDVDDLPGVAGAKRVSGEQLLLERDLRPRLVGARERRPAAHAPPAAGGAFGGGGCPAGGPPRPCRGLTGGASRRRRAFACARRSCASGLRSTRRRGGRRRATRRLPSCSRPRGGRGPPGRRWRPDGVPRW